MMVFASPSAAAEPDAKHPAVSREVGLAYMRYYDIDEYMRYY